MIKSNQCFVHFFKQNQTCIFYQKGSIHLDEIRLFYKLSVVFKNQISGQ